MTDDLEKIQAIELEALTEIIEILEKNNLKYYLRGGSVMGTVKYSGFIPWDDDMDISLPRTDYEKFIRIFSNDWSDKFWLASYRNGDAIHAYFPRVLIKESYRIKQNLPRNNHLGFSIIDVLPIDGVPTTKLGRNLFFMHVAFLRALGAIWTLDVKDTIMIHKPGRQRILHMIKSLGIQRFYSQENIYKKLEKLYSKHSMNSSWIGTITGSMFTKEVFRYEVFGQGVMKKFENINVRIPSQYDKYLKQLYGQNYANEVPDDKKSHLIDKRIVK
ncbi:LicD family protein [Lapidilactobacillus wuchangensis]|uniref:LicD family protein n=1 Tax=Lapidilactobacillus wuchangensis TaxID=2486001 RepID=UPI000F792EB1|nr:LicD family protein [Lapidilactobacillus wuchangensis]